ncbi:hypothetical protein AVEN_100109-1 [Araneus ventricosus]|uniref:Uncharacterized protein n=1 Tax=Araneus ventricosus TaxID=182803 RepID=A0A4Y2RVT2_ARAVE|nr:hypothetical protein AVEN_100109-1 [Araneus ventricosus]
MMQYVPGVSSNMELETSRITNEIRAGPLTIPEEEMGFRGHCPVDSYANKFSALVPPKEEGVEKVRGSEFQTEECKTRPLMEAYLEEEKNCGLTERQAEEHEKEFSRYEEVRVDSGFVEEKVSGSGPGKYKGGFIPLEFTIFRHVEGKPVLTSLYCQSGVRERPLEILSFLVCSFIPLFVPVLSNVTCYFVEIL